jgi:MFS transporter, UMF1 family
MEHTPAKPTARSTFSWILYDFANTAYSMTVVSFYFSIWVVLELGQRDFYVSLANGVSMLLVAITMPFLGDLSDFKNNKVKALFIFTLLCVTGTTFLGILGYAVSSISTLLPLLLLFYVIANYSFQAGLVYYNSLLPFVSTPKNMGRVSGYGTGIGYVGAIVGLAVASIFVDGTFFGFDVKSINGDGSKAAFFSTAVLFLLFSIPIFLYVREPKQKKEGEWSLKNSFAKVTKSLVDTKKHPGLVRFLIGRLLYEDGIQTIIFFMGVYTQAVMGFTRPEAAQFFMIVIPSAIFGSIVCGIMSDHFGAKKTLITVLVLWLISLTITLFIVDKGLFYLMGFIIGALMGTADTASRPLFISLVPKESLGEFFGLYAVSGKIAAVLGPFVWSAVTLSTESFGDVVKYKAAVGAMILIMLVGTIILVRVPDYHKKIKDDYVAKLTKS